MKCSQCHKDYPDDEVTPLSQTWSTIMVIGHMLMGTYQIAKRKPGIFPRHAGDLVCRQCRIACATMIVVALGIIGIILGLMLLGK